MPGPIDLGRGPVPMSMWEQLKSYIPFSGAGDIELPTESGMVDPRIPQPLAALRKAFNTTNEYAAGRESKSAIDALRAAGRFSGQR